MLNFIYFESNKIYKYNLKKNMIESLSKRHSQRHFLLYDMNSNAESIQCTRKCLGSVFNTILPFLINALLKKQNLFLPTKLIIRFQP